MFEFLKSLFSSPLVVDLSEVFAKKPMLIDVRTPMEFAQGHPKGAINIPLDRISNSLNKLKGKKDIVVFCRSGNRSSQAKSILMKNGIQNVVDAGTVQNVVSYTG